MAIPTGVGTTGPYRTVARGETVTATTSAPMTEVSSPHVTVLTDRCAGCQECVIRCPSGALSMDSGRWIALADDSLCVGCRQCVRTCPFSAITVTGPVLVAERVEPAPVEPAALVGDIGEIRQGYPGWTEALAEAQRCLSCPDPTCVRGCPAHNDIPSFIAAIRDGDLDEAHRVLRLTSVLPDACSRVCNHSAQCEGSCTWSLAGGTPVAIGRLERFITDTAPVPPPTVPVAKRELTVAVVGAGPAGIGAAWELVEAGASVTVYEKDDTPGGLCNWGIPDFTLPESVAARPWDQLVAAGVTLWVGAEVHPADVDRLLGEHDAVILAHGASSPLRLSVPGSELDGVTDATTFLKGAKLALEDGGDPAAFRTGLGLPAADGPAPHVLVLGAGNTAMDVARTARRLGLGATCVDWLDERFALARPDELAEARHEGVQVRFRSTLTGLDGAAGRVCRATLAPTVQNQANQRPKVLTTAPEAVDVDLVVMAMGYRADPAFAAQLPGTPLARKAAGLPDRRWIASGILANPASAFANHYPVGTASLGREVGMWAAVLPFRERLWAVGDALVGPSTVVEAMAHGRLAAQAVLDSHPRRPGQAAVDRARRVLVCYESRGGKTARAAQAVADAVTQPGDQVQVLPITKVGPAELAGADLLVLGTWVEGLVVAKVRPARATRAWLAALPRLGGKPVGIFCTYRVAPRGALAELRLALQAKGARVLSQAAFGPADLAAAPALAGAPPAAAAPASGIAAFGQQLARQAWPERAAAPAG